MSSSKEINTNREDTLQKKHVLPAAVTNEAVSDIPPLLIFPPNGVVAPLLALTDIGRGTGYSC